MKKNISFLIFIFFAITCLSQEKISKDTFTIHQKVNSYYVNGKQIEFYSFEIFNEGKDNLWLWFEKDETLELPNNIATKKYFYNRKGDVSLYQMGMESNIEEMIPEIFSTFLKKIDSKESFIIQMISDPNSNKKREDKFVFSILEKHIRIITESECLEYISDANIMNDIIFYKDSNILLLIDFFIKE